MSRLTVMSDGAGQDSWTILLKLVHDVAFRQKYAPKDLVVVHADTGNEHPETYKQVERIKVLCTEHGIEYVNLTADKGFHRGDWVSLQSFYAAKNAIGSKCYPKTCTDNLKVQPIYRWLEQWIQKKYFPDQPELANRKKSLYAFAGKYGKITVLIGIAADEAKRRIGSEEDGSKWQRENLTKVYPLVDLGYNRQQCQDYMQSVGAHVPPPSNCMMCPFKSDIEILWTYLTYPEQFGSWVTLEANKIAANRDKVPDNKNFGVNRLKMLPQVVAEAKVKYADWTYEMIDEYRMSHGHCVASAY